MKRSALISGGVAAALVLCLSPVASAKEAPSTARRAKPVQAEPKNDRRHEKLRLACKAMRSESGPGIACMWSASKHPKFAGYMLVRGAAGGREVVFKTRERDHTRFLDTNVRRGVEYRYAIHVVDSDGKVIGMGGPVRAGLASDGGNRSVDAAKGR